MVLLHFPLKNFERAWKRSQTQRNRNEKSETRSSEKLDRQNLKRDREWRRYRSLDASQTRRKEMYELATIAHRQYLQSKQLPKQISLPYYHHQPPVYKYKSPLLVYEPYLTDNIIYYCAFGGWKAGSLNQKICL